MSKITAKQLVAIYGFSRSTFNNYIREHIQEIKKLGSTYKNRKGKVSQRRFYNPEQLNYLIFEVFKDTPEGYEFDGKTLQPIKK